MTAGADLVVELPVPFATSNAELFAKGAIKLLSSIPAVDTLCFGAEWANADDFLKAAALLNDEPAAVSQKIKAWMAQGASYAKARAAAFAPYLPEGFLTAPNNVLGVEYTRAILASNVSLQLLPISRIGGGYRQETLSGEYSSATAIRAAISTGQETIGTLPSFVRDDLPKRLENRLDTLEKYAVLQNPAKRIARVCDCTEGLENAFKKAATQPAPLVETLTSPRYTSARIRRIALQNLLGIEEKFVRDCLAAPLYLRVLAAKKGDEAILEEAGKSPFPLLIRGKDGKRLEGVAKECFERDTFAEKVYALLYPNEKPKDVFY